MRLPFYCIPQIFFTGLVIYSPAVAMEAVSAFPLWASIIVSGLVSTIYTTLGGIKGVVITDALQAVIIIGGLLAVSIYATFQTGGIRTVMETAKEKGRLDFFDFSLKPGLTFYSVTIGATFHTLTNFGIGQGTIQRYSALPSLSSARKSIFGNIPALIAFNALTTYSGLVVYAFYAKKRCDPLRAKYIQSPNQILPFFINDVLVLPGLSGIFLSVLFAGSLSSLSTLLNGMALVTWTDFLAPIFKEVTERRRIIICKFLVIAYGIFAISTAFLANFSVKHVLRLSLSITGAFSGPTLGVFILGATTRRATAAGVTIACLLSTSLMATLSLINFFKPRQISMENFPNSTTNCKVGLNFTESVQLNKESIHPVINFIYELSFLWYSLIGCLASCFLGYIFSFFLSTAEQRERVDSKLLFSSIFKTSKIKSIQEQHKMLDLKEGAVI
ncbi:unnamed protein product [Dimorphilus gyrociliatus]|uniref:Uncharacterized protein n=1 Tax=Dimorphilus gyrociliatus TaxID=2664684 RepID=A0A7I8W1I1_9ANNE|nr:unnamed protein product [Dimorphilus gyrociliatus]